MLEAVLRRGETLEQAQGRALEKVEGPADKAFALAIANESLRWQNDCDQLIDSATRRNLESDARPRIVLRMMLAQLLRLNTPPHAIVATCLPLLKDGQRKLAHGVFSTLAEREVTLPEYPSLPLKVGKRLRKLGKAMRPGLGVPPPVDLALKDWSETQTRAEAMGGISLAPGHIRLPRGTPIDRLPSYDEGAWWVQDIAATLPGRLLGRGQGPDGPKRVLDMCAAPGGKTLQLAAAGWQVTALDSSEKRLERLRENLTRTGLEAEIVVADALTYTSAKQFDAILLDAPCTATGTCRRHPDVLHRIGSGEIGGMAFIQSQMLKRAADWLPAGGTLVYAVCSLEREEGEDQVAAIELPAAPITAAELPEGLAPTEDGHLRTHPGMLQEHGGMDGFFIARWQRG